MQWRICSRGSKFSAFFFGNDNALLQIDVLGTFARNDTHLFQTQTFVEKLGESICVFLQIARRTPARGPGAAAPATGAVCCGGWLRGGLQLAARHAAGLRPGREGLRGRGRLRDRHVEAREASFLRRRTAQY